MMHGHAQWARYIMCVAILMMSTPAWSATELKLGHVVGTDDPYHIGATKFAELASQYTNGAVHVTVFPNGQFGGEREMIEAVKLGTLQLVVTANGPVSAFEPKFMLFDLPFVFRDAAHAHRVLDGPIGQQVAAALEPQGMKVLCWMESGFRDMITIKKKIASPDDMRGLRFRTMENPVYVSMFKSLGATPVPIPSPEIYLSLQNGIVDGNEAPLGSYMALKFYEVAKMVAFTDHTFNVVPLLINLKTFGNLPGPQQEALRRAARDAAVFEREYVAKNLDEFKRKLRAQGVQFYEVDKKPFQQKMGAVYREFEPRVGKDLIDAILRSE